MQVVRVTFTVLEANANDEQNLRLALECYTILGMGRPLPLALHDGAVRRRCWLTLKLITTMEGTAATAALQLELPLTHCIRLAGAKYSA